MFKIVSECSENEAGEHFSCQTHCNINPYNLVPSESKQKILLLTRLVSIHLFLWRSNSNLAVSLLRILDYTIRHTHTHTFTHTFTHTHSHTHIHIHTHTHAFTHTHTFTHTNAFTHTHSHTHIFTRTHTFTHTHTLTHIHIHTHTLGKSPEEDIDVCISFLKISSI